MNDDFEDQGVLQSFELDLSFGERENNFELKIDSSLHCCQAGWFIYIEDSDYGGIIDTIESNNTQKTVTYSGRTWQGFIGSKVLYPLLPDETGAGGVTVKTVTSGGESLVGRYLIISGAVDNCLEWLIGRAGLDDLIIVDASLLPTVITEYQFERYPNYYKAIDKMLKKYNLKLNIRFSNQKCHIKAVSNAENEGQEEFNSDHVQLNLKRNVNTINHLVCLGSGELEDRLILHLYADQNKNISETQTFFGVAEYSKTYELPSTSIDELKEGSLEEFQRILNETTTVSVDCSEDNYSYDVGDIVNASDNVTGIDINAVVTQKIVSIRDGLTNIEYKVGEE